MPAGIRKIANIEEVNFMKRLVIAVIAGAFGSLMLLPMAHAQDWWDMNNDADSIRQDQRNIWHDRQELREDLERGDFGVAAREQEEMEERRAHENATRQDLNDDLANHYYGYGYHHDYDDDD
jgi:hypothetical protein